MEDPDKQPSPFIFLDPHGKRWPRLRLFLFVAAAIIGVGIFWFLQALFVQPELQVPASLRAMKGKLKKLEMKDESYSQKPATTWQRYMPKASLPEQARLAALRQQLHVHKAKPSEIRLGFYDSDDANSQHSLALHAQQLTHICADWMVVSDGRGTIEATPNPNLSLFCAAHGLTLMPLITNLDDDTWIPEAVENLANGPAERRAKFILNVLNYVQQANAGGVVVDFEEMDPTYTANITALLRQMATALHSINKQLWLVVPMDAQIGTYDIDALKGSVDRFVAQLFDENSDADAPAPVASLDWFEGWLQVIQSYGNPDQWIGVVGCYGYDWRAGAKNATMIGFADAMSRANYADIDKIEVKAPTFNAHFSYADEESTHTVWFLDAISFANQLQALRDNDLGGVGIQRLGQEDPGVWNALTIKDSDAPTTAEIGALQNLVANGDTLTNIGKGDIVSVDNTREDGARNVQFNAADSNYSATYTKFPSYPILYHEGWKGDHEVAITFDDGPDPTWTPKILDILKQRHLHATFFLVGEQAEANPDLVKRILAEGHLIGNHTYTHPNLDVMLNDKAVALEANATQRLIESITGRSTTLFRPPYNADSSPTNYDDLRPLEVVQEKLGYLIVLESIDPEDWERPGTDQIVQRIIDQRNNGNIILLHDAGGDRSQTVAALPRILDFLQARGDKVVSISTLLDASRDDLLPFVKPNQAPWARRVTAVGFAIWHQVQLVCWTFMIVAMALILLRTFTILVLAAIHHWRDRRDEALPPFTPAISVVMAAYNEGKVIRGTLSSLLATDYAGEMEIVIIDDGSRDNTADEVRKMAVSDARIRLIQQANAGKSAALQRGIAAANHEVIVFLDADTHFERSTIANLVSPLRDLHVAAVSGNAKVGNLRTFIARCQSLEYVCGFNLDRRAYTIWNCVTVAPGAISAFRKSKIEEVGGFSLDTLAEDTDLTLSLHKAGYRIEYASRAVAWTEAPETFRALAKQRFRWAFGTMQCLWKHRDLLFSPQFKALGWFSLPSIWAFQVALVAVTPIIDTLLILSFFIGSGGGALWIYLVIFLLTDVILAFFACLMEGERWWKAWIMLPMRIIYRPLLSWVIWRALYRAIKGAWVTWGKLERTASVIVKTQTPQVP